MNSESKNLNNRRRNPAASLFEKNQENENPKESYFDYILSIMNSPYRSMKENKMLVEFLLSLTDFANLIKSKSEDYLELMNNLSLKIKHEKHLSDTIIFRTGEVGDKFYLILNGKIGILLPKDETVELTEEEYFIYLLKLKKFEEIELLNRCMINNKHLLSSPEYQDIEKWTAKQKHLNLRRSMSRTNLDVVDEINNALKIEDKFTPDKRSSLKRISNFNINIDYKSLIKKVTVDEYINRIKPVLLKNRDHKFKYKIYNYHLVTTLGTGKQFGELALINQGGKRSATIMAVEDCNFGVLDKKGFDKCLKNVNEKEIKNKLNIITSIPLFEDHNKFFFRKKFLNLFVSVFYNRGDRIITEGDFADKIFILKDGEIEIKFRKSLNEVNDLILSFGGNLDKKKELDFVMENDRSDLFMKEKRLFKLAILKNNDILGLNDMTIDNKYIFTIEITSSKAEFFFLEKKFLKSICSIDTDQDKVDEFINRKKSFVLDRLITFKKSKIDVYKDLYNLNDKSRNVPNEFKKYINNTMNFFPTYFNTMSYKTIHTQYEKNSILRKKDNITVSIRKKKKKINLDLCPPINQNNSDFTNNDINKMYDTIDNNNTFFNVSSAYNRTEDSNILLHKIKKKENSNVVDFLAMDSINRDLKHLGIDDKIKNEYYDRNLSNSISNTYYTNISRNKSFNKSNKISYYSVVKKMNLKKLDYKKL